MAENATLKYKLLNTTKTMKSVGVMIVKNGASIQDTVWVSPGSMLEIYCESKPVVPTGVKILSN